MADTHGKAPAEPYTWEWVPPEGFDWAPGGPRQVCCCLGCGCLVAAGLTDAHNTALHPARVTRTADRE